MTWEDELRDLVDRAHAKPTFQEWLTRGGYPGVRNFAPQALRSLMVTLYRRYQTELGNRVE